MTQARLTNDPVNACHCYICFIILICFLCGYGYFNIAQLLFS